MRKYRFLFLVTALCILASCAKEDRFSSDGFGPSDMAKGFGHCYNSKVFMVPPPNGTNDTESLMSTIALAQSQGSGSVVQLQKGIYHIGFIEIREFEGTIRGAGMGKTIIKLAEDLPCLEMIEYTGCFALFSFIGGDIKMQDISFIIEDGRVCVEPDNEYGNGYDLYILLKFTDAFHDFFVPDVRHVKACVENIEFDGGIDNEGGSGQQFNVNSAIWFGFDYGISTFPNDLRANGDMTVRNCSFKHFLCAIDIPGLGDGNINITTNIFKDLSAPLFIFDNINTKGVITNNSFSESLFYDLLIWDLDYTVLGYNFYPYSKPSTKTSWKISGNTFNTQNFGGEFQYPNGVSIYLLDARRVFHPEENLAMEFFVNNNTLNLQKDAKGIVGYNNIGAMVVSNKFKGTGVVGISLDVENGGDSKNNKILGNNFSMADYETDIYLGEYTSNCLVAGSPMATIVNDGVNNHITGNR
jgi:hypothetical protein